MIDSDEPALIVSDGGQHHYWSIVWGFALCRTTGKAEHRPAMMTLRMITCPDCVTAYVAMCLRND